MEKREVLEVKSPIVVSAEGAFAEVKRVAKFGYPGSHYFLLPKWWLQYWNIPVDGDYWVKVDFSRETGAFTLTPLTQVEVNQLTQQVKKE